MTQYLAMAAFFSPMWLLSAMALRNAIREARDGRLQNPLHP